LEIFGCGIIGNLDGINMDMDSEFEVSLHPEIFLRKHLDVSRVSVDHVKLNDHYDEIDLYDIIDIYIRDYDYSNDNFTRRLEKLKTHDGFIHLAGKISFGIVSQKVNQIILRGKYMEELTKLGKEEIIQIHDQPDKIRLEENSWEIGVIDTEILIYNPGNICFFIDNE
jgi:hypothetical protein